MIYRFKIETYKSLYLNMDIKTILKANQNEFKQLCEMHHVDKLYAFGSSVTNNFNQETSDIDLLIKLDIKNPLDRGEALLCIWDKFEALFGRKVDLLTEDSLRNPVLKENINRTKKLIYDRERAEVFS